VARLLLDSTVLIDLLRGRRAVARVLAERRSGDVPYTSAVNVEEIVRGMRPSESAKVGLLFDGLRIVPIGREVAEQAGRWRREHAASGVTLSQADCLVAAAARSVHATLATANVKDFPMPEVRIELWPSDR